jgi:hypothetical protein
MPTYADFGGRVISTIAGRFVVTADTAPIESTLKDVMEFGETGFADHEQSPPHQRTHAAEHYAKLIDRSGRYGRFRHAHSFTQAHTYCLEPAPL